MTFIDTIPEDDAEGATADWYAADRERFGYRLPQEGSGLQAGDESRSWGRRCCSM